jgi:hypothetical protein
MADAAPASAKTPWHLWVLGVLAVLWNSVGALDFTMTQTKNEAYMKAFTPEQLEYFYSFPPWVVIGWGVATWGSVIASILLLSRRRLAVPFFLVALLSILVTMVHNYVLTDGMKVMGGMQAVIFAAVIFLIGLLLWLYAGAMNRRGVLR